MTRSIRLSGVSFIFLALSFATGFADPPIDSRLFAPGSSDNDFLSAFSSASAEWGSGTEALIEQAFRACFRTYLIDGKILTLHLPFSENNERSELAGTTLAVPGGGKASPEALWDQIDSLIATEDFKKYVSALSDGHEKLVLFDLKSRSWSTSRDWFTIGQMKAGTYPGLPHQPVILSKGDGISTPAIYNYLYSVGRLGIDCSGFVWYVLTSVAKAGGLDLNRALSHYLGASSPALSPQYIGTWFFDSRNKNLEIVKDEIRNLRPADVFVFRGPDGETTHSAIIQSIDFAHGTIRYMQSTDVAEQDDRGVHESFITFDPARLDMSLKDPSIVWHQRRTAPFVGEAGVDFWDDGTRYRAFPDVGGGFVVRLKLLQKLPGRAVTSGKK
jgi:hypothetical protein